MTWRTLPCQIHKVKRTRKVRGPCPYCARVQQEIHDAPRPYHPRRPKSSYHKPGPKPKNLRAAPKPPAY